MGMGEEAELKTNSEIRLRIGAAWFIIESGSVTRSADIIAMSLRTQLHSWENSSGEPAAPLVWERRLGGGEEREEMEGAYKSPVSKSIRLLRSPVRDLGRLEGVGVGGERERLEDMQKPEKWRIEKAKRKSMERRKR